MIQVLDQDFLKSLYDFMCARLNSAPRTSKEYVEAEHEYVYAMNRLSSVIPSDQRRLLMELDEASNKAAGVAEEIAYQRGFSDGIKMVIFALLNKDEQAVFGVRPSANCRPEG